MAGDDDLSSTRQAIGEATCATAQPTASLAGNAVFQSPPTYSTQGCLDAVVVDILDMPLLGVIRVAIGARIIEGFRFTQLPLTIVYEDR